MKTAFAAGVLLTLLSASSAFAQVSIRQFQQQGAATPYPNSPTGSDVGPLNAPQTPQAAPQTLSQPMAPVAPATPSQLPAPAASGH
jgi:hypothetical protein